MNERLAHRNNLGAPIILNVVSSTRTDLPLDIEQLATKLRHVVYEPEMFPGLIYRRHDPKATIIMFSTGKIVSIGSKSERVARKSLRATASEIARLTEEQVVLGKMKTENVVAMFDAEYPIDIRKLAAQHPNTKYEPDKFPGAICQLKKGVTVLIFKSGKMVLVGSKSEYEAKSRILHAYRMLEASDCILQGSRVQDPLHLTNLVDPILPRIQKIRTVAGL